MNTSNTHNEHLDQPVDGLLDAFDGELVDALAHVVWHACHGRACILYGCAGRECLSPRGTEVIVKGRNCEKSSNQYE
jgi:hypothetical protein